MTVFHYVPERACIIDIGGLEECQGTFPSYKQLKYNSRSTIHTVAVADKKQASELTLL